MTSHLCANAGAWKKEEKELDVEHIHMDMAEARRVQEMSLSTDTIECKARYVRGKKANQIFGDSRTLQQDRSWNGAC